MPSSARSSVLRATLAFLLAACSADCSSGPRPITGNASGIQPCADPQVVSLGGADTGFVECASGALHRPKALACPPVPPRTTRCAGPGDAGAASGCHTDADCTAHPNGRCIVHDPVTGAALDPGGCGCYYGCSSDADCAGDGGPPSICQCGDPVDVCVPASCTTDADCGSGLLCTSYATGIACNDTGFACQTPQDTCGGNLDCHGNGVACGIVDSRHACISCAGP